MVGKQYQDVGEYQKSVANVQGTNGNGFICLWQETIITGTKTIKEYRARMGILYRIVSTFSLRLRVWEENNEQ